VRELENMVERAVLMARGRVVMPSHFPARVEAGHGEGANQLQNDLLSLPFHKSVAVLEKHLIKNALRDSAGNKTEAANRLQINRRLLYKKMVDYEIKE
jgi:DNA-binding NtrC family response regulator